MYIMIDRLCSNLYFFQVQFQYENTEVLLKIDVVSSHRKGTPLKHMFCKKTKIITYIECSKLIFRRGIFVIRTQYSDMYMCAHVYVDIYSVLRTCHHRFYNMQRDLNSRLVDKMQATTYICNVLILTINKKNYDLFQQSVRKFHQYNKVAQFMVYFILCFQKCCFQPIFCKQS